jgi:hypothetical protein
MHSMFRTRRTASVRLALAAGAALATLPAFAAPARAATPPVLTNYSMLNHVQVTSYVASPVQSPPINGFVPHVVFGLTNEDDPDAQLQEALEDQLLTGINPPGGNIWLPNGTATAKYLIATLDTGAQSHIISYADTPAFDFPGNELETFNSTEVIGASGTETVDISMPLGVYMTGLGNATTSGSTITPTGALKGHYNASVLSAAQSDSILPNIIGAPIMAQYQVAISNSNPKSLTVGSTTYHSPQVTLTSLFSAPQLPTNYYRMTLEVQSPSGVSPVASYFGLPEIVGSEIVYIPQTPTFWSSLFANVSGSDAGNSVSNRQLLFDTGAQVTVFSEDTAAEYGYYSGGPEPSTPEFMVDVEGVGGTIQVPGFYVDNLKVLTNGGYVTWNNVPVLVLDLPDARDGVGYLPGVLGMNLFTDRDLIVNGGLENPAVAFSQQFQWNDNANGLWSESAKWIGGTPNMAPRPAQFLSKITAPRTITVDGDYTIGNLTFDNANRYTIGGAGRLTLQNFDSPTVIGVYSGSHTINAPMTLASETIINVAQPASKLTITNDVTATGIKLTKTGDGTVEMKNVRADSLALDGGTVAIIPSVSTAATSVLKSISATNGKLDLQNTRLIVRGTTGGGTAQLGSWNGSAYTGITGLVADGHLITTQSSATAPNFRTTLGVATADQIARVGQPFGGQTILAGDVLVMYTYAGDADLDGSIDGDDFGQIDSGFSANLKGYFNGDFNYSGKIDADDYFLIDANYGRQGAPIASGAAAVPEPAALSLMVASFAIAARRRRV